MSEGKAGFSGVLTLFKYDRENGALLDRIEQSNTILTAGLTAAAAKLRNSGSSWNASNLSLLVNKTGGGSYAVSPDTLTVDGTTYQPWVVNSAHRLVVNFIDDSTQAYTSVSSSNGVKVRVGSLSVAEVTGSEVTAWGAKAANETWRFEWTVTCTGTSANGVFWPDDLGSVVFNRLGGTSGYTSAGEVQVTLDAGSITDQDTLTWVDASGETETSSTNSYVVTSTYTAGSGSDDPNAERITYGTDNAYELVRFTGTVNLSAGQSVEYTHTIELQNA